MRVDGFWTGEYLYDKAGFPTVEFQAELRQLEAIISGNTTEFNTFDHEAGQIIIGELFGKVAGHSISFTKVYKNTSYAADEIAYTGSVSDDGKLITGRWNITGVFSGSFRMIRAHEQKPVKTIVTANDLEVA